MKQSPTLLSKKLKVISVGCDEFKDSTYIPEKYTCDGADVNPSLTIKNLPPETKSLVLIIDDPDALFGTWVHWLVWNIPITGKIKENSIPGTEGLNDFKRQQYGGPCPPSGNHNYHFKIYALNTLLDLKPKSAIAELEYVMNPFIIGFGEVVGQYRRVK